jgi:WhiB family redox-sensing transcriptional regulator
MIKFSPPAWQRDALCQEIGVEVFFPPDDKPVSRDFYRQAKRICNNCPVIAECLEFGISEQYGVWGGTTPQERVKIREQRRKSKKLGK